MTILSLQAGECADCLTQNLALRVRVLRGSPFAPSNPTGAVYKRDELAALADVLLTHPHVLVLSDDVYEDLIFDGAPFFTIVQVEPRLAARTLTMNGVSIDYAMTGWRIAYGTSPRLLRRPIPGSTMAFERRRKLIVELINAAPGLTCPIPDGAFYACASCSALIGLTTAGGTTLRSDLDVAAALLDEAGVATVHGSAFGLGPYIGIGYALDNTALRGACRAIETFCSSLAEGGLVGHS